MKVLLINGSPHKQGNTAQALSAVAESLCEEGVDSVTLHIGAENIRGCTACGGCRKSAGGLCVFEDAVNEARRCMADCDGLVVGTPVYYSGIAGTMKSFLDRFFYSGGAACRYKPAAGLCVLRRSGGADTFHQLNNYFHLAQALIVPTSYWSAIHGSAPGEVREDLEGMQMTKNIGRNMAWMIKMLAETKNTLPPPEPLARISTNFIR